MQVFFLFFFSPTGFSQCRENDTPDPDSPGSGDTYDAIILAVSGLERLHLHHRIGEVIDPSVCPYTPGQGALGIQTRADDADAIALVAALNHAESHVS